MKRIAIIGITSAGKTTLAEKIHIRCAIPHIDLDALYWGPGWTETPPNIFRIKVADALQGETWVASGNYSKARTVIWTRADTLIWLDYPLFFILQRLWSRTLNRVITHQDLGNGNRESWREQFWSRDSIFLWAIKAHKRYRREFPTLFTLPEYSHLHLLRFRNAYETERWLEKLNRETT